MSKKPGSTPWLQYGGEKMPMIARANGKKQINPPAPHPPSPQHIESRIKLIRDAERYCWLRDNGHLDMFWSVQGPSDKAANIDADIDEAMKESP